MPLAGSGGICKAINDFCYHGSHLSFPILEFELNADVYILNVSVQAQYSVIIDWAFLL